MSNYEYLNELIQTRINECGSTENYLKHIQKKKIPHKLKKGKKCLCKLLRMYIYLQNKGGASHE